MSNTNIRNDIQVALKLAQSYIRIYISNSHSTMSLSLKFTHSIQYLVHLTKYDYHNITKIILAVSVGVVFNHEAPNGRGVESNVHSGLQTYNILTHSLQSPPQWQSAVYFKAALTHLHAFLHPFWQPQRNNSRVAWLASGIVVHTWYHYPKLDQPQLEGEGRSGASWRAVPQQYEPWNTLRLKWSINASFVGGMSSIPRPFFTNSSIRVASTPLSKLVQLYRSTVKRSRVDSTSSVMVSGSTITEWKASVRLSKVFHMSQAVFFPLLAKKDTVSQPV